MGDRLTTIDMGRKVGAALPLSVGGGRSPSNTMSPGFMGFSVRCSLLRTKWHLDPFSRLATLDVSRKVAGAALPLSGELGSI